MAEIIIDRSRYHQFDECLQSNVHQRVIKGLDFVAAGNTTINRGGAMDLALIDSDSGTVTDLRTGLGIYAQKILLLRIRYSVSVRID